MNTDGSGRSPQTNSSTHDQILFWGCFLALVTTAFGFIARMFLIDTWGVEFSLDAAQKGRLAGIGIWPFAVSIIGFSLIIDKIGYKLSMVIAFLGHIAWACMGFGAYYMSHERGDKETAFQLLYWGSLVCALANGTVEAFINPVVATMFSKDKTKWLNILHAGWPGGLVAAGILTIYLEDLNWGVKVGLIAAPAVLYLLVLLPLKFPVQEREAAGVTYRDMLSEFGILGALIVGFLITLQMMDFYSNDNTRILSLNEKYIFIGIGAAIVVAFGLYTRDMGRFLLFFLILIMMPLATTEIGTDGWITDIMKPVATANDFHAGWVLVYTSAIMLVLRFFAGPIVHALTPLGLLAFSAVLAIVGLYTLSFTTGVMIFVAASLYGISKTFFWPTMLGVVSEQMPKGGALTLNAISGIGMLAVGTLGFPYIGTLQANKAIDALVASKEINKQLPDLVKDGKLTTLKDKSIYEIIHYQDIDNAKLDAMVAATPAATSPDLAKDIKTARDGSKQGALLMMAVFPGVMLAGYLILLLYFKAKGGYKPVELPGGGGGGH